MHHFYAVARKPLALIGLFMLFFSQSLLADNPKPSPKRPIQPQYLEVHFEKMGRLIYISASVDGVEGGFILDTGAPGLVLNSQHFHPEMSSSSPGFEGVTGGAHAAGSYFVGNFTWKGLKIYNFESETLDLKHLEKRKKRKILGLIGNQIFKGYEMEIDYEKQKIRLYLLDKAGQRLSEKHPRTAAAETVSFRLRRNIPVITAYLGAAPMSFVLDTGSEVTILRDDAKEAIARNFIPGNSLKLASTGKVQASVEAGKLENLSLGAKAWKPLATLLVDMSGASQAYSGRLDGILGHEFLSEQKVGFNYVSKELYFYETQENA